MNCTTESAIYVMELTVMGWVPMREWQNSRGSMPYDSSMLKGTPPGVSSLSSAARILD